MQSIAKYINCILYHDYMNFIHIHVYCISIKIYIGLYIHDFKISRSQNFQIGGRGEGKVWGGLGEILKTKKAVIDEMLVIGGRGGGTIPQVHAVHGGPSV